MTWTRFLPCSHAKDDSAVASTFESYVAGSSPSHIRLPAAKIDLLFYFHQEFSKYSHVYIALRKILTRKIPKPIKNCFRDIRYVFANIPEEQDTYPFGASEMFWKLFQGQEQTKEFLGSDYDAFYYMEPDNVPCRAHWLDKLYQEAACAVKEGSFWIKGSIARQQSELIGTAFFADHINGNALYNLRDARFFSFMKRVHAYYSRNPQSFLLSYDIAIFTFLTDREALSFREYSDIKHLFVYVEWVQNVYRAEINGTALCQTFPNTFLLHGKNTKW